jgi:tripartite-type tricarboxylate transporter receptor subunit TctC
MVLWTGVLAPVGTSKEIIARLHGEIVNVLGLPEVKETLARQGAEPASGTPEQFAAFIKAEFAKWSKVITDAKIVID